MNFYEVLNVSTNATEKDIKKAYRLLAKKYHPDTYEGNKDFAETKMQEINIAYDTLSNSNSRKEYDKKIGVIIKESFNEPIRNNKSYYQNVHINHYNKSGVNYDVRYTHNNRKIKYDSRGYAESNYYTSDNSKSWKSESVFSIKNIKEKLLGKNLVYTVTILIVAVVIITFTIYKAVESMNEFFESTQGVYNKINSAKEENKQEFKKPETNWKEQLYPFIENTVSNVKNEGKAFLDNYNKYKEEK